MSGVVSKLSNTFGQQRKILINLKKNFSKLDMTYLYVQITLRVSATETKKIVKIDAVTYIKPIKLVIYYI